MGIRIQVRNYRCLRQVDWSPNGVSVLVGPNGSGKSTLLDVLDFLRIAFQANLPEAISHAGGRFLKNLNASPDETISFTLEVEDCIWSLEFGFRGANLQKEYLIEKGERILLAEPFESFITYRGQHVTRTDRIALRSIKDLGLPNPPSRLLDVVDNFRVYGEYSLPQLRTNGSVFSSDMQVQPKGLNAFTVLRNWRDKREYRRAYDFVFDELRRAFPGVADDLEFESGGQANHLLQVLAENIQSIPAAFAPNGWLAGLLHLIAFAGAPLRSVIAFDEFENSLHPFAVRHLTRTMKDWAAKRGMTIILAGHSPALLDEFRDDPERVFVMEPGQANTPMRLTDYRDPEWLKQFSLGELYRHEDFGGPKVSLPNGAAASSR